MVSMLILYLRYGCIYCERVLDAGKGLGTPLELKNIEYAVIKKDLVRRGGKSQVPYLVDTNRGVEMYESEDIVIYLRETYGPKSELQ